MGHSIIADVFLMLVSMALVFLVLLIQRGFSFEVLERENLELIYLTIINNDKIKLWGL
jgi:hypothetical protein